MTLFMLTYGYHETDLRAQHRDDHVAYLNTLRDNGALVAAGPYGDLTGGAILFQAENEAEVESLIEGDPYTRLNVTKDRRLREWRVTVGSVTG
jgi:uncharacterized protein YciI